jgi:nucleotide-binding universal stress UspA family protein
VLVETDAVRGILDYAAQHRCDLIVMPTHGHGALHRLVLGSVTAEVFRHAPCPVWTGCHFERPHAAFHSVLCAIDFHSQNHALVQWAAGFAREFGAELHLLHAVPASTVQSGSMYFDPQWHDDIAVEARRRMTELAFEAGAVAESHAPLGDIPSAIAETAGETHSDLVVIGRGPKAYSVIRAAPCPVVVV